MRKRAGLPKAAAAAAILSALPLSGAVAQDRQPPPEIAEKLALCVTCHGENGVPVVDKAPVLFGQEMFYLLVQLRDYRAGRRANETMSPIAKELSDAEMKGLATYFSEQKWPRIEATAEVGDAAKAERLAVEGQCSQCHLSGFVGNSRVPRVSNQKPDYLGQTMSDFRDDRRKNAPAMAAIVKGWSDDDIAAMARYLATL
ncbi:c-type cytochrome [Propylenella binzhouense]|uniref:Cytochrome C n=1 Tax=Propylenella binzhouense TaxID=2555902 RepID=A0A964T5H0_9HYPH|nr:c-type cytochrome [Propylenella binzhouense]MYZ48886.1 cytochrome C [Propylenella binzhouense]